MNINTEDLNWYGKLLKKPEEGKWVDLEILESERKKFKLSGTIGLITIAISPFINLINEFEIRLYCCILLSLVIFILPKIITNVIFGSNEDIEKYIVNKNKYKEKEIPTIWLD